MKTLKIIFAALLAAISLATFTSCGENDDEPDVVTSNTAKEVAGRYKSDLTWDVMGQTDVIKEITIVAKATDDSTIELQFPSFGMNEQMTIPAFTIPDVKVVSAGGIYEFAETHFEGTSETGKKFTVDLTGDYKGNTINLRFQVKYGSMPMPMSCKFSASKQQ